METAIIFMSKHGTTEKVSKMIQKRLSGKVTLFNITVDKKVDLSKYDRIIIGGSIHEGRIQKNIQNFVSMNQNILLKKKLGLFICCMNPDNKKKVEEFENAYPLKLRTHSSANGILGGELLFDRMNFFEKIITKAIAKTNKNISNIDGVAIDEFIKAIR